MKYYAVDREGNIVTLTFGNEDKMETAFNKSEGSGGQIRDETGQQFVLDVSYGYSQDRLDFAKLEGRNTRKMDPLVEKDIQGDM